MKQFVKAKRYKATLQPDCAQKEPSGIFFEHSCGCPGRDSRYLKEMGDFITKIN